MNETKQAEATPEPCRYIAWALNRGFRVKWSKAHLFASVNERGLVVVLCGEVRPPLSFAEHGNEEHARGYCRRCERFAAIRAVDGSRK